jgi:hypothetical protein
MTNIHVYKIDLYSCGELTNIHVYEIDLYLSGDNRRDGLRRDICLFPVTRPTLNLPIDPEDLTYLEKS